MHAHGIHSLGKDWKTAFICFGAFRKRALGIMALEARTCYEDNENEELRSIAI